MANGIGLPGMLVLLTALLSAGGGAVYLVSGALVLGVVAINPVFGSSLLEFLESGAP